VSEHGLMLASLVDFCIFLDLANSVFAFCGRAILRSKLFSVVCSSSRLSLDLGMWQSNISFQNHQHISVVLSSNRESVGAKNVGYLILIRSLLHTP
jgi:hypothetical protein